MKKILIVDDDKYFTDMLSLYLEFKNFNVDVINTADELFGRIKYLQPYSTILLDIMFRCGINISDSKKETGEKFYEQFRKTYPDKPVIVLSAKNKGEIDIDFNHPNTDFVGKPLSSNIQEILDLIQG